MNRSSRKEKAEEVSILTIDIITRGMMVRQSHRNREAAGVTYLALSGDMTNGFTRAVTMSLK